MAKCFNHSEEFSCNYCNPPEILKLTPLQFISRCKSTLAVHLKFSEEKLHQLKLEHVQNQQHSYAKAYWKQEGYVEAIRLISAWFKER